jgi:hypothetical protein
VLMLRPLCSNANLDIPSTSPAVWLPAFSLA